MPSTKRTIFLALQLIVVACWCLVGLRSPVVAQSVESDNDTTELAADDISSLPAWLEAAESTEETEIPLAEASYVEPTSYLQESADCCPCDTCCGGSCTTGCGGCATNTWFRAGYLLWWSKATDLPVLATTSTDPNGTGVLDAATTQLVFGGRSTNGAARGGGKFAYGRWLDDFQSSALEVEYLFLGEKEESFFGSQDTFTVLARPFFNVDAGVEDSRLIVSPGDIEGSLNLRATTELHSSAIIKRKLLSRSSGHRLDYLWGYRFAYLGDAVSITEATTALSGAAAGTTFDLQDTFETHNLFHGAEVGFEYQRRVDRIWNCVINARVALGGSRSETQITGQTVIDDGATVTNNAGGLLTQQSNLGTFVEDEFNTVSRFGVSLNRHIFDNLDFTFGYDFLFWSQVWRAPDQIDLNVNPTQIPPGVLVGPALPAFQDNATSYWAHGISFNLEGRF